MKCAEKDRLGRFEPLERLALAGLLSILSLTVVLIVHRAGSLVRDDISVGGTFGDPRCDLVHVEAAPASALTAVTANPPAHVTTFGGKRADGHHDLNVWGSAPAVTPAAQARLAEPSGLRPPGAAPLGTASVIGSQPWVVLLCRVADSNVALHDPVTWYTDLMGDEYPGFNHYWQELSFGAMNITGTQVAGVYTLTQPSSAYWYEQNGSHFFSQSQVIDDCTGAADPDVFYPDFAGIHLILPAPASYTPAVAETVRVTLSRDGQTKAYGVTLLPLDKPSHQLLAHEWAHGLGLWHSSGPYDTAYDSGWDVVSGARFGFPCKIPPHPVFGCVGQHTIAYHKDTLGWIPPSRVFTATVGRTETITIEQLASPPNQEGSYLYAKIPIELYERSGVGLYSVEARRLVGYDAGIPGEAIVLHKVDTFYAGDRPAQVVDVDGNGDPNDDGATWLPGETYSDTAKGVILCVESETPTGYVVTIGLFSDACGITLSHVYLPVINR